MTQSTEKWAFDMSKGPGFPWEKSANYLTYQAANNDKIAMLRIGYKVTQPYRVN